MSEIFIEIFIYKFIKIIGYEPPFSSFAQN